MRRGWFIIALQNNKQEATMKQKAMVFTVVMLSAGVYVWQTNKATTVQITDATEFSTPAAGNVLSGVSPIKSGEKSSAPVETGSDLANKNQIPVEILDQGSARAEEYFATLDASEQYRKYFREIGGMGAAEQESLARELIEDIDGKESQRIISKPEAVFLKLALKKQIMSESAFKTYAATTINEYKAVVAKAEANYKNRKDPLFEAYKERESKIVKEVLGMESFPDGLSRSQYLRRRLDEVRDSIYSQPVTGG